MKCGAHKGRVMLTKRQARPDGQIELGSYKGKLILRVVNGGIEVYERKQVITHKEALKILRKCL